ncbi:MAG TPA: Ig-like domain-containing protein [Longimicrobiaceae bacterium]|nr:Ig-like domain-containing protein [Longimicrobiaceae bacterium]
MTDRAARVGAFLLSVAAAGCAHIQRPTGGPVDKTPPQLVATRPDSLAVVPTWSSAAVFAFDEGLSEKNVDESVIVSPHTSSVRVGKSGNELRVSLGRGWQRGVIYHIVVRPVIQDLFNNRIEGPLELVFSTGPAIPDTHLGGTALDRVTAKPDTAARVEAIHQPDSLVYVAPVDSAGHFALAHIPAGLYRIRAFRDLNRNGIAESYEAGDTARATVDTTHAPSILLSLVQPDSTAPRLASVQAASDSVIELKFDDYLDPSQPLGAGSVQVLGPDGKALALSVVAVGAPRDVAARTAAVDSTAADSVRADTLPADSLRPDRVLAQPASQSLTIGLASGDTLAGGATYRIVASGIRNVVGLTAGVDTTLSVPARPPAPAAGGTRQSSSGGTRRSGPFKPESRKNHV